MAWQRSIPFGYRMERAQIICEQTEAETVKQIFSLYLNGHSLGQIAAAMTAQAVRYHAHTDQWNKNMVKRILENDRYLDDGTDLGPVSQQNMDSFDIDAHSGNIFIEASSLPEAARDLDVLKASLTIKSSRTYYYMELGGPAYFYYEPTGEAAIPFSVENSVK